MRLTRKKPTSRRISRGIPMRAVPPGVPGRTVENGAADPVAETPAAVVTAGAVVTGPGREVMGGIGASKQRQQGSHDL